MRQGTQETSDSHTFFFFVGRMEERLDLSAERLQVG